MREENVMRELGGVLGPRGYEEIEPGVWAKGRTTVSVKPEVGAYEVGVDTEAGGGEEAVLPHAMTMKTVAAILRAMGGIIEGIASKGEHHDR